MTASPAQQQQPHASSQLTNTQHQLGATRIRQLHSIMSIVGDVRADLARMLDHLLSSTQRRTTFHAWFLKETIHLKENVLPSLVS